MESQPSEIVAMIRQLYPEFLDHTNIGSRSDVSKIASIAEALDALPDGLVPGPDPISRTG